jgi:hypothetical protein
MSIGSSNMRLTSFILTGYLEGLEKIRHEMDSVPYEKFPYCCSSDNTIKYDVNLNRPKTIVKNKEPIPPMITNSKNQPFWTP